MKTYEDLTREELIERLQALEARIRALPETLLECGGPTPLSVGGAPPSVTSAQPAAPGLGGGGLVESKAIQSGVKLPHSKESGVKPPHSEESGVEPPRSEGPKAIQSAVRPAHSRLPKKDWPHAPVHRLSGAGVYMVTAGTLHKEHAFRDDDRLDLLETTLLSLAKQYDWQLEAWAVFANHYHFIGRSPADPATLQTFLSHLHTQTAAELNRRDGTEARPVWYNFWDSRLTFERSYLARLHYVHHNPVHHQLVPVANQYRWCSAAWFERTATAATINTIYSFKTDKLKVYDDF